MLIVDEPSDREQKKYGITSNLLKRRFENTERLLDQ
jgi:hypothetical protein